jgi:putative membrane protein
MTKLSKPTHWFLLAAGLTLSAVACGDDDDDVGGNTGGTAGRGGTSLGGSVNEAGFGNDTSFAGDVGTGGTLGGSGGRGGSGGTISGSDAGGEPGVGGAGGEAGAGEAVAALSDAQILLVLDTLNQGEVEEAYAALPRLSDPDVETFAQMMITDHSSARQAVATTADDLDLTPVPSAPQRALVRESEAHVAELRATPAANIDETYVDLEVAAHADALALLGNLNASADAAELRTLIATLRATVQDHYDAAQTLQDELQGSGGNGGSGGSP